MSVKVSNITKNYGKQLALDQVSVEIPTGEIVGLLGPNGAGKSTLMKIITCFLPPTSGTVLVNDFDINENPVEVRRLVGYLPENNPLYTEMYVKEYLKFTAGLHKLDNIPAKVSRMIELTGLGPEQHKLIGQLSKGYRQRVGIAQALIHDPSVLILDEPTSGLDPNQLLEIRSLIKEVGAKKTVLFSTHIMQEVEALCSRVIIINKGKVIANEATANLNNLVRDKSIYHVEFSAPVTKQELQKLGGLQTAKLTSGNLWEITSATEIDLRPILFDFAVKNKVTILSMQRDQQSVEQIFQWLTK
ncbi:MAG: gliding motility-associated ABC transporter ATP-binding subunit GldA [Sphingobacteriia bacterium]|jgi:ABC-2 type transport system ATP-binding protein|nr:gliding motility-associated ABC transporter ATP-binding subunit GldA [Sphingobacteriia bacterium]